MKVKDRCCITSYILIMQQFFFNVFSFKNLKKKIFYVSGVKLDVAVASCALMLPVP